MSNRAPTKKIKVFRSGVQVQKEETNDHVKWLKANAPKKAEPKKVEAESEGTEQSEESPNDSDNKKDKKGKGK